MMRILSILIICGAIIGCQESPEAAGPDYSYNMVSYYPAPEEFMGALNELSAWAEENNVMAYTDTLEDGMPNKEGSTMPLVEYIGGITAKGESGDWAGAADDVYHFDGSPFSLISYLMKAQMVGDITAQQLVDAFAIVPLPPLAIKDFGQPRVVVEQLEPPCDCAPEVKIRVVSTYRSACGNRTTTADGYAANNVLNNISRGILYKFYGEVENCPHGGTWSHTVTSTAPSYATGGSAPGPVTVFSESAGTVTITFTYTCSKCNTTGEETFNISFR